jgi:hypothetical protein
LPSISNNTHGTSLLVKERRIAVRNTSSHVSYKTIDVDKRINIRILKLCVGNVYMMDYYDMLHHFIAYENPNGYTTPLPEISADC